MNDQISLLDPDYPLERHDAPSSTDGLFQSHEDWWNNACLNWGGGYRWTLYATGYKDAADVLVQRIQERSSGQDTQVYPILFLYRQYLELQLKELIQMARLLLGQEPGFPKDHHIGRLWAICFLLLKEVSPDDSLDQLKEVGRLIDEFATTDPTSQAFRYPEDRQGQPSLPGLTVINLRNVREVIGKIAIMLSGAGSVVDERLQFKQDLESEYREDY
jgi:hypothetical protein